MPRRVPFLTLALIGAAAAIHVLPGATLALQFDRSAIAHGEWWRLFTAHLTHFDANHLAWDAGFLLVVGWFVEREAPSRFVAALALASSAITLAVWLLEPQFEIYRGLSGLDCALFGMFAGLRFRQPATRFIGVIGIAAALAKPALEISSGATLFASGIDYAPVPLAHFVGTTVGLLVALAPAFSAPGSAITWRGPSACRTIPPLCP